jgi:GDPmannose 4,6-dehydratase
MNKTAIVTGITGQDGFYLAHYLLSLDYRVIGLVRRTSLPTVGRLRTLIGSPNLHLIDGDVTDISSIQSAIKKFKPNEFYHLAAQSHVAMSWEYPLQTADTTGVAVLNCLEAIKSENPEIRFYFAGSSEQFGNPIQEGKVISLNEDSPMEPESPYAAAKVFGYNITRVYRRSFDMFASCGILFNHESPLRGEEFVTRKITKNLARVKWGLQEHVELGNMDACRDWGFAGDYVKAMHAMLQQDKPDDFVIATGNTYSVKQFFNKCCEWFELDPNSVYKVNPKFMRPKDVEVLLGDSTKARNTLGWKPECNFDSLVEKMCLYDFHLQSPDSSYYRKSDQYLF